MEAGLEVLGLWLIQTLCVMVMTSMEGMLSSGTATTPHALEETAQKYISEMNHIQSGTLIYPLVGERHPP